MFKKIISKKGFWRSVLLLGFIYAVLLFVIQWALIGFPPNFFSGINLLVVIATFALVAFICGFSITYAKFFKKLKQDEYKK